MKALVDIETLLGAWLKVRHSKGLSKLLALLSCDFSLRNVTLVADENNGNLQQKGKLQDTHRMADASWRGLPWMSPSRAKSAPWTLLPVKELLVHTSGRVKRVSSAATSLNDNELLTAKTIKNPWPPRM
jgi:hypothetical protein